MNEGNFEQGTSKGRNFRMPLGKNMGWVGLED